MPTYDSPRDSARSRGRSRNRRTADTARPASPAVAPHASPAALTHVSPAVDAADTADNRTFAQLGVNAKLVEVLDQQGIVSPFPIQSATLPDALAGRDVLGRGRTGSGKTLAFSLPLLQRLTASTTARASKRPRALVLAPTRELANQILATLAPLAQSFGLTTAVVYGGVGQGAQASALRAGVDVLVACPGRLEDLLQQRLCDLGAVEVTVLDEADHMADLGFLPAVKRILDKTPGHGQRLLFSATLDNGIDILVKRYLTNPVLHSVDPEVAPVSTMTHHVFEVNSGHKLAVVRELAAGEGRSLLFTRTKHGAKNLAKQLTAAGIPAVDLHGNLAQRARERNLDSFSNGSVKVLVATDIAARGIHVDDIELVVHVDPPAEHKAYLHRSGRTARAGSDGVVVTVMTSAQRSDVRVLAKQAGISPVFAAVVPGASAITALTGPAAALVTPSAVVVQPSSGGGSGRRTGGGRGSTSRPRSQRPASGNAPRSGSTGQRRGTAASASAGFSASRGGRRSR